MSNPRWEPGVWLLGMWFEKQGRGSHKRHSGTEGPPEWERVSHGSKPIVRLGYRALMEAKSKGSSRFERSLAFQFLLLSQLPFQFPPLIIHARQQFTTDFSETSISTQLLQFVSALTLSSVYKRVQEKHTEVLWHLSHIMSAVRGG